MRRRGFIAVICSATAVWPLVGRAQQPKLRKIGVLVAGNPDPAPFWRVFREALRDLGYIDGQTIFFEFRSAGGKPNLLPELAAELVRLKVDIIVVWHTPVAHAASQATREIPIVMADVGDPVGTGLIASLARPGGNVTGLAGITAELAGKSVQLIREMLPSARRVAVMLNVTDPFAKPFLEHIQRAGQTLGVDIQPVRVRAGEEFDASFPRMSG